MLDIHRTTGCKSQILSTKLEIMPNVQSTKNPGTEQKSL
jgi:hypothetical protein